MNAIKNQVRLIGHLGMEPEIRQTEAGKKWARFSLATNETYRASDGTKVTETQWHSIVAWGKLAEITERILFKGSEVAVEGKLVNRSFTTRDGVRKNVTEVSASQLLVLSKKKQHESVEQDAPLDVD
jgi:single-strand DNA-binding protein